MLCVCVFFFSSRRRHTRLQGDWSSDVCSSDLRRELHLAESGCTLREGKAAAVGDRGARLLDRLIPDGTVEEERSEEHTSELQSPCNLVCRLLLEKKKTCA